MSNVASRVLQEIGRLHGLHHEVAGLKRKGLAIGFWQSLDPVERRIHEQTLVLSHPDTLHRSSALWISADMVKLLRHASTSLPPYDFDPDILPWKNAVAFAETPLFTHTSKETTRHVMGIQWFNVAGDDFLVAGLAEGRNEIFYRVIAAVSRGQALNVAGSFMVRATGEVDHDPRPETPETIARLLCTLWLLLRQRVATKTIIQGERQSRRRLERETNAAAPTVTVIELRKPITTPSGGAQVDPVDWSHRWIVDGHWRNQFHPSTDSHVPTWIAPYVKGPDDKPLVVKDRIHSWVR